MSTLTINDTDFLEQLQKLPFTAKQEVLDFINEKIRDEERPKKVPEFGWGKDLIVSYVDDDVTDAPPRPVRQNDSCAEYCR